MRLNNDKTIAEIRATRRKISAEFGHDPQQLIVHYIKLQQQQEAHRSQQKLTVKETILESPKV